MGEVDTVPSFGFFVQVESYLGWSVVRRERGPFVQPSVVPGQHGCGIQLFHPKHQQRVEVTGHLPRFGPAANPRLHIRPGLGISRDLETSTASLVQQWHKLITNQFIEFIGVQ